MPRTSIVSCEIAVRSRVNAVKHDAREQVNFSVDDGGASDLRGEGQVLQIYAQIS
jgi:hypothetical protein